MNSEIINIYNVCKHIAENKHSREVNDLFVEELSELIKAVMKLERYNFCDNSLRCAYHEIYDNIYEELADVIIMMFQFICKNKISHQNLFDEISNIYNVCKHIAENKHSREVNDLFVEELSELIKAVMKLERYNFCDNSLRCAYHEIYYNIYEELADVIIMMFQFICKNKISHQNLLDEISKKIIRYYETISDK